MMNNNDNNNNNDSNENNKKLEKAKSEWDQLGDHFNLNNVLPPIRGAYFGAAKGEYITMTFGESYAAKRIRKTTRGGNSNSNNNNKQNSGKQRKYVKIAFGSPGRYLIERKNKSNRQRFY